jgi:antitoxin-like ribbon-helix-helix protein
LSNNRRYALYLPPAVHDQLRELAFARRVKMHALVMEGLDHVFRANGLKSIAELCDNGTQL